LYKPTYNILSKNNMNFLFLLITSKFSASPFFPLCCELSLFIFFSSLNFSLKSCVDYLYIVAPSLSYLKNLFLSRCFNGGCSHNLFLFFFLPFLVMANIYRRRRSWISNFSSLFTRLLLLNLYVILCPNVSIFTWHSQTPTDLIF
jgi:hypothetical protein